MQDIPESLPPAQVPQGAAPGSGAAGDATGPVRNDGPNLRPSGSWFGKDVKYCSKCGKGSTKADRDTCKECGASVWMLVDSADADGLKASITSEAKMMAEMEGKDAADDVVKVCKLPDALAALQEQVDAAKASSRAFEFRGVHLGKGVATGKSVHDLLTAFLYWAQKPEDREAGLCPSHVPLFFAPLRLLTLQHQYCNIRLGAGRFNISKAFRRLQTFAEYQEKYFDQFFSEPVLDTEPGVLHSTTMMPMQIPAWTCHNGHVMWFMDLKQMVRFSQHQRAAPRPAAAAQGLSLSAMHLRLTDVLRVQKLDGEAPSDRDLMRWMWMVMLQATFDYPCAIDGAHIIETFDGVSFMEMVKMNGKFGKVEKQLQELFYGCAPFKMKSIILVGSPFWMNWLIAITRLFISKKMSEVDSPPRPEREGGSQRSSNPFPNNQSNTCIAPST